jgi:Rha family phage regulatory protein
VSLAALVEIDPNRQPVVEIRDGEVFADSRNVATFFRKRHADVIRSIRNLHCSEDFRRRNFASFEINDLTGTSTSHFLMTKLAKLIPGRLVQIEGGKS